MSRNIRHTIEIDASPAMVWATLTDTASFRDWNPFMHRAEGELRPSARLEVEIEPPGGRSMKFKPTVLSVEPEHELRWIGRLIMPGLFDGEHSFRLEPLESGSTRFTMAEHFTGLLVPLFGGTLAKTQAGIEQMNVALKARAEAAQQERSGFADAHARASLGGERDVASDRH
jgi:hypothetical protein